MRISAYHPKAGRLEAGQEWINAHLELRDRQLRDLTTALSSRLDFASNFNAEVRELTVNHDTEARLRLQTLKGLPIGVFVIANDIYDYAKVKWQQYDASEIDVKVAFDTAPTGTVQVTLLILGSG